MSRKLLLFAVCSLLWGCAVAGEAKPIEIKVSNHVSPDTAQTVGLYAASKYIKEKSGGRLDLQVYHSGSLSPQDTIIQDTQIGQIDMCLAGPSQMGQYYPPISILGAPYLFGDLDHMYKVVDSDIVKPLYEGFREATDLIILDYWALGIRNVSSNIRATTPEEFARIKMRAPTAPMYITAMEVLGTNPTPIPVNETYLALQTGTVDAQENPLNFIESMKFYEVQKYIILTKHMVDGFAITINPDTWKRIPADLQQIFLEGIKEGRKASDNVILTKDDSALETFRKSGLEIIETDNSIFQERAARILKKYESEWLPGMFEQIANFK